MIFSTSKCSADSYFSYKNRSNLIDCFRLWKNYAQRKNQNSVISLSSLMLSPMCSNILALLNMAFQALQTSRSLNTLVRGRCLNTSILRSFGRFVHRQASSAISSSAVTLASLSSSTASSNTLRMYIILLFHSLHSPRKTNFLKLKTTY